jgi:hypothetical protein
MGVSRIELEIGELVLDGVPRAHRDVVAAAFARELTRLLRERGDVAPEPGPPPPLPATTGPRALGRAIARSVHEGLCGGGE